MSGRHYKWIKTAGRHALRSGFAKYRMAAVLVKGGRVIAVGLNRRGSGVLKFDEYIHGPEGHQNIHAELDTILRTMDKNDLCRAELYVAGISRAGKHIVSKPCDACQKLLSGYNLKGIYYHDAMGQVALLA